MESQNTDTNRTRRRVAIALVVFVILFIIWWLLQQIGHVPSTIGLSPERSKFLITQAGFDTSMTVVPAVVGQQGRVILQSPKSGWRFKWWPVATVVSAKAPKVVISANGINAPYRTNWPPIKQGPQTGRVIVNDPEEMGVRSAQGYNAPSVVPDVQSQSMSQAKTRLSQAGLSVQVFWGPSSTKVEKGHVFYQNPAPGTVRSSSIRVVKIWLADGSLTKEGGPYKQFPYPSPGNPDLRPLP